MPADFIDVHLPSILEIMLDVSEYHDWLKVTLTVDVMIGENWGEVESIGIYTSTDWSK